MPRPDPESLRFQLIQRWANMRFAQTAPKAAPLPSLRSSSTLFSNYPHAQLKRNSKGQVYFLDIEDKKDYRYGHKKFEILE